MPFNPASSVFGPKHVVKIAKSPILAAADARMAQGFLANRIILIVALQLSNKARKDSLPLARAHLQVAPVLEEQDEPATPIPVFVCRHCGEPMIIIEVFERPYTARAPPIPAITRCEQTDLMRSPV